MLGWQQQVAVKTDEAELWPPKEPGPGRAVQRLRMGVIIYCGLVILETKVHYPPSAWKRGRRSVCLDKNWLPEPYSHLRIRRDFEKFVSDLIQWWQFQGENIYPVGVT